MHVAHLLFRSARRFPDRPLWLLPDGEITYRIGARRVAQLANALIARFEPRSRITYVCANRFEGLEIYLGTMAAGFTVVPINPKLLADEIAFMINDSGSAAVFYSHDVAPAIETVKAKCISVRNWICVGGYGNADIEYENFIRDHPDSPPDVNISGDDVAWLFYTSGTTGKPKGAMETHRNLLTMTQQFLIDFIPDATAGDVILHAAPISHGSASCMLPHLCVGAANAFPISPKFDPDAICTAIEKWRVTTMFLAPTMINILVRYEDRARRDLSSLKTILYGGGPMYVEQLKEALSAFGAIFVQIYGQGEAPMTVTCLPKSEHVYEGNPDRERRLASSGRETTGVVLRILDDEDRELPSGQMGEVCVRSDLVMSGYWNRPEATSETLRNGWLHTGDIGFLDPDGYLFITDRKKDMIISGGSNVYPREVEEVLLSHPAIAEACVFGVPDTLWGEAVKAIVVARDGMALESDGVMAFCRERLTGYKRPKSIEFVPALPKNSAGKILKRQLREPFWAGRDRRV